MAYGRLVKEARIKAGLSQKQLSDLTGVKYTYINNVESEKVSFSLKKANELLKFIGYEIQETTYLTGQGEENHQNVLLGLMSNYIKLVQDEKE